MSLVPKPRASTPAYTAPPLEAPQALAIPEKKTPALNLEQLRVPKKVDLGASPGAGLSIPSGAP